jgi:hypothetical protein
MTTTLREVLNAFETAGEPLSLAQMARDLELPPGMLEGMIMHWVRKGKIREVGGGSACEVCGSAKSCRYAPAMPRSYELATGDTPRGEPPCACCG